jgi:hypothetical protein
MSVVIECVEGTQYIYIYIYDSYILIHVYTEGTHDIYLHTCTGYGASTIYIFIYVCHVYMFTTYAYIYTGDPYIHTCTYIHVHTYIHIYTYILWRERDKVQFLHMVKIPDH